MPLGFVFLFCILMGERHSTKRHEMQYFHITPEVQDLVIQDRNFKNAKAPDGAKSVCIRHVTLNLFWEELKKKKE